MIFNLQNNKFTPSLGYTLDDQHNITTEADLNVTGDLKVKSEVVATNTQLTALQNAINEQISNINTTNGAQTAAINTNSSNITNLQNTTVKKDDAGDVNIIGNLTVKNEQVGLNKDIVSNANRIDNLTSIVRPIYRIINSSNNSDNYNIQVIKGNEEIQLNPGLYQVIAVGRGGSIFDNYFGIPGVIGTEIVDIDKQTFFSCGVDDYATEFTNLNSDKRILDAASGNTLSIDRYDAINYYYDAYKEASAAMITGLPYFGTVGGNGTWVTQSLKDYPVSGTATYNGPISVMEAAGTITAPTITISGGYYSNSETNYGESFSYKNQAGQTTSYPEAQANDAIIDITTNVSIDVPYSKNINASFSMFHILQSAPGPCGLGGGQIFIPYQDGEGNYMTSVPGDGGVIIIPIEYYN